MLKRRVLFFVKAPEQGGVKSRLAEAVGQESALALYKSFGLDMLAMLKRSGYPFTVYFTPPEAAGLIAAWLGPDHTYAPQKDGDIGGRMRAGFEEAFAAGTEKAVLIGSDIPDLPEGILDSAFAALETSDAVLGPAEDGGYYLIGFKKVTFLPALFEGVSWSTDSVFEATEEKLRAYARTVAALPPWRDVDTLEDLRALERRLRDGGSAAPRTKDCIAALFGGKDSEKEEP